MILSWLFIIVLYILVLFGTWFCSVMTMVGWSTNNKLDVSGWFMEFKSFLIPLWIFALAVLVFAPILIL